MCGVTPYDTKIDGFIEVPRKPDIEVLYPQEGASNVLNSLAMYNSYSTYKAKSRKYYKRRSDNIKFSFLTAKNNIRHTVKHDYHDHAYDLPAQREKRKTKGGVAIPFPVKLHKMLDNVEIEGLADIVSWQPHGRAFVVHKPKKFVDKILPSYFKQSKLGSFQRQLNLYGFSRITSGKDRGGYYHELFLRNKPFLSDRMVRKKVKGTRVRGISNPEAEPDFYRMPPIDRNQIEQKLNSSIETLPFPTGKDEDDTSMIEFEGKIFHALEPSAYSANLQELVLSCATQNNSNGSSSNLAQSDCLCNATDNEMLDFIANLEVFDGNTNRDFAQI